MKINILKVCAIGEALTGIALFAMPSFICWLLFGQEALGVTVPVARIAGIALISFGIACCSGRFLIFSMLFYSTSAMLYLIYISLMENFTGILLWPAVILHGMLAILLIISRRLS